ncbi:hypothetical protein [uncultured Serinicoccus sp.]|uniref:hypothetical protein n=1 Tax=uncultured Serinicoccus sp. TaxID=735514 RepID=UPI00260B5FD2|nr:hypothetical protein [uncultured Serinicoccus sp.]
MTDNQCHTTSKDMSQNARTPCAECPWRVSNIGRPVPDDYQGTYDRPQRVAVWSSVRHGSRELCHLSVGADVFPHQDDPAWQSLGYVSTPSGAIKRECGGYVAALERELERLSGFDTFEEYQQAYPNGLTREGLQYLIARTRATDLPPLRSVAIAAEELIDPAQDDDLTPVELAPPLLQEAMQALRAAVDAETRLDA